MSKNKTYAMDELFKQSPRHEPVFDQENQVCIIANFYETPEDIYEWLTNQQYLSLSTISEPTRQAEICSAVLCLPEPQTTKQNKKNDVKKDNNKEKNNTNKCNTA